MSTLIVFGYSFRAMLACATAFASVVCLATPATAHDSNQATALGEIVVTAELRSENILKVSLPVSAISEKDLAQLNIQTPTDLIGRVPNLTVIDTGTAPAYTIRGIGI